MLSGRRLLIGDHNQLPPFGADQLIAILSDHSLVTAALNLAESLVVPLMREGELDEMNKLVADAEKLRATSRIALRLLEPFRTIVDDDERMSRENPGHRPIATTLTLQRRMDPAIARIVSNAFYKRKLDTLPARALQAETSPSPFTHLAPFPPSPVVVVNFRHISASGNSARLERGFPRWHNPSEVDAVVDVLRHVRARPGAKKPPTIAVLSPYKAQVDKLHNRITALLGTELRHLSQFRTVREGHGFVGTVDSFQGSEADLVILSLVRNNQRAGLGALGFLRDKRRMNVALSRAKSQLVIVGSLSFLREAVRGVNPDAGDHALSFLTDIADTIDELCGEKRGKDKLPLAQIISPEAVRLRK
jgi:superfamily I DNA and/or RNA helicase